MSAETVCGCCLANSVVCKDLTEEYDWMGEREVYSDMLMECFDIKVGAAASSEGICHSCVWRLRDATCFKRQVLNARRNLAGELTDMKREPDETVPEQPETHYVEEYLRESDSEEDDKGEDGQKTLSEAKVLSKQKEPNVEILKRLLRNKVAVKLKNPDTTKPGSNIVHGPNTVKPEPRENILNEPKSSDVVAQQVTANDFGGTEEGNGKLLKPTEISSKTDQKSDLVQYFMKHQKNVPEEIKHKINTSAIIKFSNVTPFKDKVYDGYICFYCTLAFIDPADLRKHTSDVHSKDKLNFFTFKTQEGHVKVDITSLCCVECSEEFADLKLLKDHLVDAHAKKIFQGLSDRILPFKLTKELPLYCTICKQEFESYKILHQHMNCHYRNYVCKECGVGFVTLRRLKLHEYRHVQGEYGCESCDKTFRSRSKLNAHSKGVHGGSWKRNKCPHCFEKFTDYYKRQRHLVEAHNQAKVEYTCHACDRKFLTKNSLTNHIKKFHLQEVNFECGVCTQKFYARRDLQRHMKRHSGERLLCPQCPKTFESKRSLLEHCRAHLEKSFFACGKCGKSFKQKSTLKRHTEMLHPGEIVLMKVQPCSSSAAEQAKCIDT